MLQHEIEKTYSGFVSKVAEGRHMKEANVDSIGQGRVWSGSDAIKIGLIDEFGGLERAIEVAAGLAKIKNYRLVGLPEQKDPFYELIDQITGNESRSMQKELGEYYKYYQYLKEVQQMKGLQSRMPFEISIN
jgi:protease-4